MWKFLKIFVWETFSVPDPNRFCKFVCLANWQSSSVMWYWYYSKCMIQQGGFSVLDYIGQIQVFDKVKMFRDFFSPSNYLLYISFVNNFWFIPSFQFE